jgi:hypothetical protein
VSDVVVIARRDMAGGIVGLSCQPRLVTEIGPSETLYRSLCGQPAPSLKRRDDVIG